MNREEALTSLAQVVGSWPKGMFARVDEDGTHKFYWAKDLIPSGGYVFGFDDWFEERIRLTQQEWPSEERIDRIGQSGPTGEHYPKPRRLLSDFGYEDDHANDPPGKYHVRLNGEWIDVYDVLWAFAIRNPGDQHAIKKMLMPGKRGHKDAIQDRREAILSLERAIQLEESE